MDKPTVWLAEAWTTPPMSKDGRRQTGFLLRELQKGVRLSMPQARDMRSIGRRLMELRVKDEKAKATWRVLCRVDSDAVIVAHWFDKDDNRTPQSVVKTVKERLKRYDAAKRRR